MATVLRSEFRPLPPQRAFLASKAKIRGYGGAMGGGKSRTLCEDAFNAMLDNPGIVCLLARSAHTSIVETTKKTMLTQVIPSELQQPGIFKSKASQGEDYVEIFNGSRCHFVGLDNPLRWYSSEIGWIGFDEAQEIRMDAAVRLITRLRQVLPDGSMTPCRASFTFNPSSPGHWLQEWFLLEGQQTPHGFYKEHLKVSEDATSPIGDCEFVFAKATDNIYLPDGYIDGTLAGMPERLRRRYLEGLWEFTEGNGFFDPDALVHHEKVARATEPWASGRTEGDVEADAKAVRRGGKPEKPVRFKPGTGPWTIWRKPVAGHRYVMFIDVSSGGSYDFSGIQVVDVEDFEQAAEFQAKMTPTEVAKEAYRMARLYNTAIVAPEITGGWGFTIEQEFKRFGYRNLYTRKVLDRLSKKWTDKTGWDTTARSRAHMLDTLDRVLREREFGLFSLRSLTELHTFIYDEKTNKPQAQGGCHDDLVMSLAGAVAIMLEHPRQLRRLKQEPYRPQFQATGY